jgi:hypothetical protein
MSPPRNAGVDIITNVSTYADAARRYGILKEDIRKILSEIQTNSKTLFMIDLMAEISEPNSSTRYGKLLMDTDVFITEKQHDVIVENGAEVEVLTEDGVGNIFIKFKEYLMWLESQRVLQKVLVFY